MSTLANPCKCFAGIEVGKNILYHAHCCDYPCNEVLCTTVATKQCCSVCTVERQFELREHIHIKYLQLRCQLCRDNQRAHAHGSCTPKNFLCNVRAVSVHDKYNMLFWCMSCANSLYSSHSFHQQVSSNPPGCCLLNAHCWCSATTVSAALQSLFFPTVLGMSTCGMCFCKSGSLHTVASNVTCALRSANVALVENGFPILFGKRTILPCRPPTYNGNAVSSMLIQIELCSPYPACRRCFAHIRNICT